MDQVKEIEARIAQWNEGLISTGELWILLLEQVSIGSSIYIKELKERLI